MDIHLHKLAPFPRLAIGVVLLARWFGVLLRRWWLISLALMVFWLASAPVLARLVARSVWLAKLRHRRGFA